MTSDAIAGVSHASIPCKLLLKLLQIDVIFIYSCKYLNPWNLVDKFNDEKQQGEVLAKFLTKITDVFKAKVFQQKMQLATLKKKWT